MLNNDHKRYMEQMYDQMYRKLFMYSITVLQDNSLAEEAVQEAFQIACAKIEDLVASPNPCGWLMNTLKFVIRNKKRKQDRTNMLFTSYLLVDEDIPSLSPDISSETEAACIQVLGRQEYSVLKRVVLKELSIREAAEELGITEDACSKRIQRNKKKLRACFFETEDQ